MADGAREYTREFAEVFGVGVCDSPAPLGPRDLRLRTALLAEEFAELLAALAGRDDLADEFKGRAADLVFMAGMVAAPDGVDMAAVAKELADLEYVLHGTAHSCGVDLDVATAEVHRSNMSKARRGADGRLEVVRREDGKVLRGSGYVPADPGRLLGVSA